MGSNLQSFYDGMTLVGSLVLMVAVIVLAYYASKWYAGRMSRSVSGRYIKIVDKIPLASGCALIVLQTGSKFYLVGFSDKNISLLCELEDFDPDATDDVPDQPPFSQLFKSFMQKSGSSGNDDGGEK